MNALEERIAELERTVADQRAAIAKMTVRQGTTIDEQGHARAGRVGAGLGQPVSHIVRGVKSSVNPSLTQVPGI